MKNDPKKILELFLETGSVSTDTRNIKKGSIFFTLKGGNFDGNEFALEALEKGAKYAVVDDPKFEGQKNIFLVNDALESLQQLAHDYRNELNATVLAIGGSNGKTTTKGLVKNIVETERKTFATRGNFNNHIGLPLTILEAPSDLEFLILEMGANHQKEHEFLLNIAKPDLLLVTNIGKDHLEGFRGLEGVMASTKEIFDYAKGAKVQVIYLHDQTELIKLKSETDIGFGFNKGAEIQGELLTSQEGAGIRLLPEGQTFVSHLKGSFNAFNILAGVAVGKHLGIKDKNIQKGIKSYVPVGNRSQEIKIAELTIFLDCYNANPSSMELALKSFFKEFTPPHYLILGGMKELGEYSKAEHQTLIELAKESNPESIFLIGNEFTGLDLPSNSHYFKEFEQLKSFWKKKAIKLGSVLVKGSRAYNLEKLFE